MNTHVETQRVKKNAFVYWFIFIEHIVAIFAKNEKNKIIIPLHSGTAHNPNLIDQNELAIYT